jgi:WD40 repeat protein
MGTVYRARDPTLDREVALKTVAPELLAKLDTMARFQREARAAARLQHPNIVTIYELGEMQGTLFIAMELLEGLDLAQAMTPADRLSPPQKLRVVVDICRGLDFAHKRGVFHRDVKPANVRILRDGTVKIVDFGIARLEDSTMTQTGMVLGTPSYMAPEVLRGQRSDHRADMWATGVVLYELLSGARPFDAPTIAALVYKIVHEPPPRFDARALQLPQGVAAIMERALAKDPSSRFRDMAEMADALQMVLGMTPSGERPLTAEARAQAYAAAFIEAQQLVSRNELEGALNAARRAQALEPSRADVVALVRDLEDRLRDAATLRQPAPAVSAPAGPGGDDIPTRRVARPPAPAGPAAASASAAATPAPTQASTLTPPAALPASGLFDALRLRGAAVFRELACFGEPPATATALISPAGDLLATSGSDGAIRIWDLRSRMRTLALRTAMHERTGHDAVATCLAFSPDGALFASGHVDGAVHLWDMPRGQELPLNLKHDALVGALAFSPDGRTLATGGMDSNLKLWDMAAAWAGEARRELLRQPAGITALCYAGPNGAWFVSGHANRVLRLTDARSCRLIATLRGPEAQVSLLSLAPGGKRFVAASHDRTIRVYDLESRRQTFVTTPHRVKPTTSVAFFPDGRHLASVAQDNAVQLWDLDSQTPAAVLWGQGGEAFAAVALFAGGDHVAVALADGRIRLWAPAP